MSVAFVLALASCAPRAAPPTLAPAATSHAGLRVRISPEHVHLGNGFDESRDARYAAAKAAAQRALVQRLRDAGYMPVTDGAYNLSAGTWYAMKWPRGEDPAFGKARLRLKDRRGQVVDDITLEFRNQVAPLTEPDRVAVSLVNHVTKSQKIASFAASLAEQESAAPTCTGDDAPDP